MIRPRSVLPLPALFLPAVLLAAFTVSEALLERVEATYGESARARFESWQRILSIPQELPERRKLELVNAFFNQARFRPDLEHWRAEDYWATPFELLGTNGGDCEDYSIAKYFTLIQLGIAPEQLRITYVKALKLNQAHMVLAYYADENSEPLILDNLINDILPGSERSDLYPVYSFNGDGLWLLGGGRAPGGQRVGQSSRLSRWSELNERFRDQLGVTL